MGGSLRQEDTWSPKESNKWEERAGEEASEVVMGKPGRTLRAILRTLYFTLRQDATGRY